MVRMSMIVACGLLLSLTSGCSFLLGVVDPPVTTVRLVNNSDFDVSVVVYYDDEQDIPRDLLTQVGTRMEFSLAPGASTSFSRDCGALQAVVVDRAELRVIGQIGPEASSRVQRDGSDFGCRDTVVFTFDHTPVLVDFAVSESVERN